MSAHADTALASYASCRKLCCAADEQGQQQQQQCYYALVLSHPQQRAFDIALTDGQHAWRGTGLKVTKPPGFTEEEAWSRARELLTDVNPAAKPAALAVTELPSGELQLSWRWEREVGAGRHVMKLPAPSVAAAVAAAGGGGPGGQQQQQPGVLLKQQPPHATIAHVLDTLVASYSQMQSCLSVSSRAQSSLQSSLDVLRGKLDSQAAAHKERERELYLKFTMLLNQKTRQLQKEHGLVKDLSAELERLKGDAEVDTDEEDRQAAYAADELAAEAAAAAAAAGGGTQQQQQQQLLGLTPANANTAAAAAAADADTDPGSDAAGDAGAGAGVGGGVGGGRAAAAAGPVVLLPDSAAEEQQHEAAAAGAAGAGADGGGVLLADNYLEAETQMLPDVDAMMLDAPTQLVDDAQLEVYTQRLNAAGRQ